MAQFVDLTKLVAYARGYFLQAEVSNVKSAALLRSQNQGGVAARKIMLFSNIFVYQSFELIFNTVLIRHV